MNKNSDNNKLKQIKQQAHVYIYIFGSGLDTKLEDVGALLLLIMKLFICDLVYGQ